MRGIGTKYNVQRFDLIDGSVGSCWANYRVKVLKLARVEKGWAMYKPFEENDYRPIAAYPNSELGLFYDWLNSDYIPRSLPTYLAKKDYPLIEDSKDKYHLN